ncbi:MAG: hypothetical protein WCR69_04430 [Sulfuricurvum sp.]
MGEKLKKGDGTIEFYANLKWLREQYESGLVVAKRLYEKAVEERGFKMGYWQFTKYFNEELNQREVKQAEQTKGLPKKIDWEQANYFRSNIEVSK